MGTKYISSMKQTYAGMLLRNGDSDRATEVATQEMYAPILKLRVAHPDAEPSPKDFNEMMTEIVYDLTILKVELATAGYAFKQLMEDTKTRLNAVKKTMRAEKERQQDINILCNRYTEFGSVIALGADDFTGEYTEDNGLFSASIVGQTAATLSIISIEGNGYEGNKYVYKDGAFLEDTISTSNRKYITDGSTIPLYEYSRITASNSETEYFPLVNFDSVEAKCTITMVASTPINALTIESPDTSIVVADVAISDDGVQFKSVLTTALEANNADKKYEIQDYVSGSGVICFPSTSYVRITLQSSGTTDDVIAFNKTVIG